MRMEHLEILIPAFNETAVLDLLFQRLQQVFSKETTQRHHLNQVTITFIDDGSTDGTFDALKSRVNLSHLNIRVIKLSRNFGHQAAVSAGLSRAIGDYIAIIDADLQDPPETILEMISKAREGYDVVYGVRKKRKESVLKKLSYWLFYRLYKFLSPIPVPLDSGDFALMHKRVVYELNQLPERIRFPRGLRSWVGFRQVGLPYERAARQGGESKYSFKDLYKLATHGVTSLSTRPLQLTQIIATFYVLISMALTLVLIAGLFSELSMSRDTVLVLIFMSISNSLIMGTLHIHGAYIGRGYIEQKNRPTFIIEDEITNQSDLKLNSHLSAGMNV